jgi:hypothetical protein
MNVRPTGRSEPSTRDNHLRYARLRFIKSDLEVETARFRTSQDLDGHLEKIAARGTVSGRVIAPGRTDLRAGSEVVLTLRREGGFTVERRVS